MKAMNKNQGFSLLEVLVALVILSIGLIGVAAVQVNTMKFGQVSQQRSNASQQLMAITERMRSNIPGVLLGSYNLVGTYSALPTQVPAADPACKSPTGGCGPQQLARTDLNEWMAGLALVLPGGRAIINPPAAARPWQIVVMWEEKDLATSAGMRVACPAIVAAPATIQCMTVNFQP
jgi:type IV pilus assembly protein PilV